MKRARLPRWNGTIMGHIGGFVAAILVSVVSTPVLACSPAILEPMKEIAYGENCSLTFDNSPMSFTSLDEVRNLGGWFVMQKATAGEWFGRDYYMITNCKTDEVVVFGPSDKDHSGSSCDGGPPHPGASDLYGQIIAHSERAQYLEIDEIERRAKELGVPEFIRTDTSKAVWFLENQENMRPIRLNCGCELLYPGIEKALLTE
jgi:hypothetical protein